MMGGSNGPPLLDVQHLISMLDFFICLWYYIIVQRDERKNQEDIRMNAIAITVYYHQESDCDFAIISTITDANNFCMTFQISASEGMAKLLQLSEAFNQPIKTINFETFQTKSLTVFYE